MKSLQIFLSYSTNDRKLCANLKAEFAIYGADIFLAHQDLSPSVEWQNTILRHLRECDIFVPVLTPSFRNSLWTDQESGVALSRRKCILPVAIGQMPHGFLARFQAIKGRRDSCESIALSLFQGLARQKHLRNCLRETIIGALDDINTYDDAGHAVSVLAMLSPFSKRQLRLILKAAILNGQIHEPRSTIKPLDQIITQNRSRVDKTLLTGLGVARRRL